MFKKLITITLTTLIALQLIATVNTAANQTTANSTTAYANVDLVSSYLMAENKLVIPKPETLPGPSKTHQEIGGVKVWFTETILTGWAKKTVGFVGMLAFLMLVISGIRYITSYGNEETAGAAKKMVIYSLVALLLALFSYAIVYIIVTLQFQ